MTQAEKILDYCRQYKSITSLDAIREFGCTRLAARIADLEKNGRLFSRQFETSRNRFGDKVKFVRYTLIK